MIKGRTVLVTRPKGQAREFAEALKRSGVKVLTVPTIKIVPPASFGALDRAINAIEAYDWVIFTSANAVQFFAARFRALGKNSKTLKTTHTIAIGPATARAMRQENIPVTRTSEFYVAESVLKLMPRPRGLKILIPRAKEAREILPEVLKKRGAKVDAVTTYETVLEDSGADVLRQALDRNKIDCVTFTSSSTVKGFFRMIGPRANKIIKNKNIVAASIGPVTTGTLKSYGWRPKIIAQKPLTKFLAREIIKYYSKGHS